MTPNQKKEIVLDSYDSFLTDLRQKEREMVVTKRNQEYTKNRPAAPGWYEFKDRQFSEEIERFNRDQI